MRVLLDAIVFIGEYLVTLGCLRRLLTESEFLRLAVIYLGIGVFV